MKKVSFPQTSFFQKLLLTGRSAAAFFPVYEESKNHLPTAFRHARSAAVAAAATPNEKNSANERTLPKTESSAERNRRPNPESIAVMSIYFALSTPKLTSTYGKSVTAAAKNSVGAVFLKAKDAAAVIHAVVAHEKKRSAAAAARHSATVISVSSEPYLLIDTTGADRIFVM